ncbi:MAG TPA: carboxypeptidase-like regulatory domain-containing protein [Thermoanaerobaculia bacterium]
MIGRRVRPARQSGLRPVIVLVLSLSAPFSSKAQTTGDIQGLVMDRSGVPISGATIEARSSSLQGTRLAVTGDDGTYSLPGLPPGMYRVRGFLEGFDSEEKTATVSLDATTTVDLRLRLSAREEVVVSGEASAVDVTSTETGTNYTSDVIAKLPLARNYAAIVRSNPGVLVDRGQTEGRSLALAVYGATSAESHRDGVRRPHDQLGRGTRGESCSSRGSRQACHPRGESAFRQGAISRSLGK